MIDTTIKTDFLDLFHHDLNDVKLENQNKLNLFTLKVKNNAFAYDELTENLGNILYSFALSRNEVNLLVKEHKLGTLISRAKEKLRAYNVNEGELGEILLYCLLEAHLNAPKILTKLELKTAPNDYVKGADGVHLLKLTESEYQLVLGESKMHSDLKDGIYEAFGSIKKLLTSNAGKLSFEVDLVNSQLIKEVFDENQYEIIKKILVPSARDDENYLDYSFGIFLGYDVSIDEEDLKLSNAEFRNKIREQIKTEIQAVVKSLDTQLKKSDFNGFNFYVYVIPFSDIKSKRKEIIKDIVS